VRVLSRRRRRGKLSGVELSQVGDRTTDVLHLRDGNVTRLVVYGDRERVLADLGLSEAP
jgi:hypothetical protein